MTPTAGDRRFLDLLGVRLGLVFGLALLPVGLIAVVQSAHLITKAQNQSEAALVGETLRAVRPQLAEIQRAQGAAVALAALPPDLRAGCQALLQGVVLYGGFASAGIYGPDGSVRCSTRTAAAPLPPIPALGLVLTEGRPAMAVMDDRDGPRLSVMEPAMDAGGTITGIAAVSLANMPTETQPRTDGLSLILFDATGRPLTVMPSDDFLPKGRDLAVLTEGVTGQAAFSADARDGAMRSYALVELAEDEIYALGSRPQERAGFSLMRSIPPLFLPALMWAVSLVAAWLAAETLVTRHIRRLRGALLDFADGSRIVRTLPMQGAPQEIRDTAEAFTRMTATILRDEAELEDALHGKEVLLREVHHRVKNNLQLIASIVNMQIRRTRSDEARQIMRSLQERMLALATIHNGLFQTTDVSEIRVDQLLAGIVDSLVRGATAQGRNVRLETALSPLTLPLDQAVPLALLMTEALSNALRFARSDRMDLPLVRVALDLGTDGSVTLDVTNDAAGAGALADDMARDATGIGCQLLRGFARQLNGQLHREVMDGKWRVTLVFRPRPDAST